MPGGFPVLPATLKTCKSLETVSDRASGNYPLYITDCFTEWKQIETCLNNV